MSKGGGPKVYLVDFGGDFGLEGGGIQAASGKGRTGGPPVNLVDFRDDLYLEWGGSQVVSGGVAGGARRTFRDFLDILRIRQKKLGPAPLPLQKLAPGC